jgi:hypothetical protein
VAHVKSSEHPMNVLITQTTKVWILEDCGRVIVVESVSECCEKSNRGPENDENAGSPRDY